MLHIDIHIISTNYRDMEPIATSHHTSVGVIHLGLIGQFHYQALQMVEDSRPTPGITTASNDCQHTSNVDSTSTENHHTTSNGTSGSEETVTRKPLKMKKHLAVKLNSEGCHMTVSCKEKIWK